MIILFIILVLYMTEIVMDALWDAEAFESGDSNHIFKSIRITAWLLIAYSFSYIETNVYLVVLIYPFLRYSMFDYLLNHFRDKEDGYKTGPWILKLASIFVVIGLITLYYLI